MVRGEHGAVDTLFPLRAPGTEHFDYLELFACYWFLRVWGGRLRGVCVVCQCTDSSALHGVLRRFFGQAAFISLLKETLELLLRHGLALDVHRISYKVDVVMRIIVCLVGTWLVSARTRRLSWGASTSRG